MDEKTTVQSTSSQQFYLNYNTMVHRIGRIAVAIALVLMVGAPITMGAVLGTTPNWTGFFKGWAEVAVIYWTSGVIEFLVYAPMLGSGASYLAFVTGNLINLKIPCAANARDICGTVAGTPQNDVVSTLSVATSSLVNIVILAVGVMCLVPLSPFLNNPALQPAFENVIPALFGALAFKYYSQSLKVTVVPLAAMCIIFVLMPNLIGSVSLLILVSGGLAIGIAYLLYKNNKL